MTWGSLGKKTIFPLMHVYHWIVISVLVMIVLSLFSALEKSRAKHVDLKGESYADV